MGSFRALGMVGLALLLAGPSWATTWEVTVGDFAFSPPVYTIRRGDTVHWSNVTGTAHTVTADGGAFDSGAASGTFSFSNTFDSAGSFSYHCTVHPFMTGTITVEPPADQVVHTVSAWDFHELGATVGDPQHDSYRAIAGGDPVVLLAGVQLPSGSLPTRLEIEACGQAGTLGNGPDLQAGLMTCPLNGDCASAGAIVRSFDGVEECANYEQEVAGMTIDNLSNTYLLSVSLSGPGGGDSLSFRSVRLLYQRQISAAPSDPTFADVQSDHPYFQFVEALAAAGVSKGCGDGTNYCPDDPVTRAQMAMFLARALGLFFPN